MANLKFIQALLLTVENFFRETLFSLRKKSKKSSFFPSQKRVSLKKFSQIWDKVTAFFKGPWPVNPSHLVRGKIFRQIFVHLLPQTVCIYYG